MGKGVTPCPALGAGGLRAVTCAGLCAGQDAAPRDLQAAQASVRVWENQKLGGMFVCFFAGG